MAEIEKKFLLHQLPSPDLIAGAVNIQQGYLLTEGGELRVRMAGNEYYLTVKGDGTLTRDEWEIRIPEWVFHTLWAHTNGRRIEKTRYTIQTGGLVFEVDEYLGKLKGLVTLECEFPDLDTAKEFKLPGWAADATDVTDDKSYKNKILATRGALT